MKVEGVSFLLLCSLIQRLDIYITYLRFACETSWILTHSEVPHPHLEPTSSCERDKQVTVMA